MSLRANVIANASGQVVASGLAFALAPLFVRELGLEAWGLVGILAVLSAWFNLVDVGLTPSITREIARAVEDRGSAAHAGNLVRCVEVIYLGIAALIAGLLALGADYIVSGWLRLDGLAPREAGLSIALMGIIVALRLCENIYRGVLSGFQDLIALNVLSAAFAVLRWGGGIVFVIVSGGGVVGLFAWQAGIATVSLACFGFVAHRRLRKLCTHTRVDFAALRRIQAFASGVAATSILGFLLTQIDKILLSKLLPLSDFGLYILAASLADALALLAAPLYGALLPRFVQLTERGDEQTISDLYMRAAQCLAAVLSPCALLLVVLGGDVVIVWTGSTTLAMQLAPLLALLALGRMINGFMHIPAALQMASGWTSLGAKLNLAAVLVLAPLILITVPVYGAIAYAWCWVALNFGYLLLGSWLMHSRLLTDRHVPWLRDAVLVPVAVAVVCMTAARFLVELPDGRLPLALALATLLLFAITVTAWATPATRALLRSFLRS